MQNESKISCQDGKVIFFAFLSVLEDIQHSIADYKAGIIGYRMDGTPVGVDEFRKQAEEALERVKNGEFFTVEQLREQRKQLLENKKNSDTAL